MSAPMTPRGARDGERFLSGAEHSGPNSRQQRVGRYTFYGQIASGGMASVHFGRLSGQVGFSKTVAIKRPHPHLLANPEFVHMFVDEARLAARIQHPNVVATLDVVATEGELFLVMDYVHGESLWHLLAAATAQRVPVAPAIVGSIIVNALHGLHAAHEAVDEQGNPLGIVHRDVSPQNVIVGVDGVARVLDFGVAKAAGRLQSTSDGQLKGKFAYMAPEQITGAPIDRRTDVYAASALLWGALAGRRLIQGNSDAELLNSVLHGNHVPPSTYAPHVTPELDAIVMCGLSRDPGQRFPTARDMAIAVESAISLVSPYHVGEWVKSLAAEALSLRSHRVREMESASEVRISMHDGVAEVVHNPMYDVYPPSSLGHTRARPYASGTPPPYSAITTSGSYVRPGEQPDPPGRPLANLVGIAALVFIVTFGGTLFWRYGMTHKRATAPDPTPSATGVPTPPAEQTPPPSLASVASPSPSPLPAAPMTATPTASVGPAGATSARPAAGAKPKKPKTSDCDSSPFFVDGEGIKRVRPECS
jgi:eukaryotic-like serine/threonine-protein kinase